MDLDVAGLLREEYQRTLRLARERRAIQLDRQLAAAKHDPQVRLISTSHESRRVSWGLHVAILLTENLGHLVPHSAANDPSVRSASRSVPKLVQKKTVSAEIINKSSTF